MYPSETSPAVALEQSFELPAPELPAKSELRARIVPALRAMPPPAPFALFADTVTLRRRVVPPAT